MVYGQETSHQMTAMCLLLVSLASVKPRLHSTHSRPRDTCSDDFVVAMVKGGANGFALKASDATQGKLQLMYDGPRPPGYQPMKKQGAIILGIGGDNTAQAIGTFFEGAITSGYSTDAADDAVQASIVGAGYGQ